VKKFTEKVKRRLTITEEKSKNLSYSKLNAVKLKITW